MTQKPGSDEYPLVSKEDLIPLGERIKTFHSILDSMESLSDKKRELWKEIYANAVTDRHNALIMYNDLMTHILNKPQEQAIHAQNITKYMERMSRSNDQLIKLAELIADAEKKEETIDPEEMYRQLGRSSS